MGQDNAGGEFVKKQEQILQETGRFFPFLEVKAQVITPKCWVWTNPVGLLTCWCDCGTSWGSLGLCCGGTRAWLCRAGSSSTTDAAAGSLLASLIERYGQWQGMKSA